MKRFLLIIPILLAVNIPPSISAAGDYNSDLYQISDICSLPEIEIDNSIIPKTFRTRRNSSISSLINQDTCHIQLRNLSPVLCCQFVINCIENRENYLPANYDHFDSFNGHFHCDRAPPKIFGTV